jgi:hypothetical protein
VSTGLSAWRSAPLPLAAFLSSGVLALGLAACGGEGEKSASTGAASQLESEDRKPGSETAPGGDRRAIDPSEQNAEDDSAGSAGRREEAAVDLTVDPERIKGARLTPTGAVQTVPPSAKDRGVAKRNSYPSINSFGFEAEGEEATNITFALVQYLTAKAQGDWATACARLYGPLREDLEGLGRAAGEPPRSCPEAYGALMGRASASIRAEQAMIDVSSVRRGEGNRAFVVYKTPDTLSADMPMYVEDGVWKVGAIDAYVLTPEQKG